MKKSIKQSKRVVIHTDLQLQYLANKKFDYSNMDSYKKCKNKKHFNQYKKKYHINITHGDLGITNGLVIYKMRFGV